MQMIRGYVCQRIQINVIEVILLCHKHIRDSLSNKMFNVNSIVFASSTTVRNLAIVIVQELSLNPHVTQSSDFHLRNRAKILHSMSHRLDSPAALLRS